jgi:hypothetical protein
MKSKKEELEEQLIALENEEQEKLRKETRNFNRKCAEFLGYQVLFKTYQFRNFNSSNEFYFEEDEGNIVCDYKGKEVNLYPESDPLFELEELPFNSDWNWIMEVVEKIEQSYSTDACSFKGDKHEFNILSTGWKPPTGKIPSEISEQKGRGNTKKEAVIDAISKFLTYYETHKK